MGPSWGRLGALLGHLGALLGPSWRLLGPSWGFLGHSWGHLGRLEAQSGDVKKNHRKTQVRMALGPSKMRPSWHQLGSSWHLDAIFRRLGASSRDDVAKMSSSCRLGAVLPPTWNTSGNHIFAEGRSDSCFTRFYVKLSCRMLRNPRKTRRFIRPVASRRGSGRGEGGEGELSPRVARYLRYQ